MHVEFLWVWGVDEGGGGQNTSESQWLSLKKERTNDPEKFALQKVPSVSARNSERVESGRGLEKVFQPPRWITNNEYQFRVLEILFKNLHERIKNQNGYKNKWGAYSNGN